MFYSSKFNIFPTATVSVYQIHIPKYVSGYNSIFAYERKKHDSLYLKKLIIPWKSPGMSTIRDMIVVKMSAGEGVSRFMWAIARMSGCKREQLRDYRVWNLNGNKYCRQHYGWVAPTRISLKSRFYSRLISSVAPNFWPCLK